MWLLISDSGHITTFRLLALYSDRVRVLFETAETPFLWYLHLNVVTLLALDFTLTQQPQVNTTSKYIAITINRYKPSKQLATCLYMQAYRLSLVCRGIGRENVVVCLRLYGS